MYNHYSDLEVDHAKQEPKYFVASSNKHNECEERHVQDTLKYATANEKDSTGEHSSHSPLPKRICGLPIKVLWIAAGVATILIVAAAVAGGVVASQMGKHKNTAALNNTTPITSSIAAASNMPSPTPTIQQISTVTTQSPQYTLLVDCPSSNWTVYTPPRTSQMFRKSCHSSFLNTADNVDGLINERVTNLNDCIDLCAAYNTKYDADIRTSKKLLCNAVCFRDTIEGNDWPGQCFGYETRNSSGTFSLSDDPKCAGAVLINQ